MEQVLYHGIKLTLDPSFMSEKMMSVIRGGRYEVQEARQVGRIIAEGEVVLEIGAGIGFISTLVAMNPKTRSLVSFEANPTLIPKIRQTLTDNLGASAKNWEVRNAVLMTGSHPETVDFCIHKDFWASSLEPVKNIQAIERFNVENFNSVLSNVRPTMIVCDIEGAEIELFSGADLSGVNKVYLEVHQRKIGKKGMIDLFEIFHSQNFHYNQNHSEGSVVLFSHVDRDKS